MQLRIPVMLVGILLALAAGVVLWRLLRTTSPPSPSGTTDPSIDAVVKRAEQQLRRARAEFVAFFLAFAVCVLLAGYFSCSRQVVAA